MRSEWHWQVWRKDDWVLKNAEFSVILKFYNEQFSFYYWYAKYPLRPGELNCLSQLANSYKVELLERVDHLCQGNIYFKGRHNFFTKLQIISARLFAGYMFLSGKVNENI